MNAWLYWRKFIYNGLSVIPLISHLKVFVNLGCFLREWSRLRRLLCVTSSEPNEKIFSLVENCMLFKTIRSAFILTLVVLLKKSRILCPKRHGIFHSKALHIRSVVPWVIEHAHKVSMGQNTARILDDAYLCQVMMKRIHRQKYSKRKTSEGENNLF